MDDDSMDPDAPVDSPIAHGDQRGPRQGTILPSDADFAYYERVLRQWAPVQVLQQTRLKDVDVEVAVQIITAGYAMLLGQNPHSANIDNAEWIKEATLQAATDPNQQNMSLFQAIGVCTKRFYGETSPTQQPTDTQFCRSLQSYLFAWLDKWQPDLTLNKKPYDGRHASLLFAVIHGRLLANFASLAVAPILPGAFANPTLAPDLIYSYLMKRTRAFENLKVFNPATNTHEFATSNQNRPWYRAGVRLGSLSCQLFAQLPDAVLGFWSWLSDHFFIDLNALPSSPEQEQEPQPAIEVEIDSMDLEEQLKRGDDVVAPPVQEDDEYTLPREPYNTEPAPHPFNDASARASAFVKHFFTPPFAAVHELRTHVRARLNAMLEAKNLPTPFAYGVVLEMIRNELDVDDTYANKPGILSTGLYAKLSGVCSAEDRGVRSAKDVRERLKENLPPGVFARIDQTPGEMDKIYRRLLLLQDYRPPSQVLSRPSTFDLADLQDYMLEQVYGTEAAWHWADDSLEINQIVARIVYTAYEDEPVERADADESYEMAELTPLVPDDKPKKGEVDPEEVDPHQALEEAIQEISPELMEPIDLNSI